MRWPEIRAGAEFFGRLPFYLHRRVSLEEARALLGARLRNREARFLDRVRRDIFGEPGSVYARLFEHAGCEYGDVEREVRSDGIEKALACLFRAGIYLTIDEFKGRKAIVRGGLRLEATPEALRSPRARYHVLASSGGSRSKGTPVLIDLAFVRDCAANCALMMEAWNPGVEMVKGDYEALGAGARFRLTKMAAIGEGPRAWFSPIDPADPALASIFRWNTRALRWASLVAGRAIPAPRYAPLQEPTPVARWLGEVVRRGRTPMLLTFAGSAVRVCMAAAAAGIDIAGTRMVMMGEPCTPARVAAVRRAGCVPIPRYGSIECGAIGYACPLGEHADEMHLMSDMHCVVPAGEDGAALGLPREAVLLTVLHERSPFLMLNLSMGDQMSFVRRDCGCELAKMGWTAMIRDVRSFEKLTGGGVTFFGTEVIPILEQVLPDRFGGGPTDYQLVEEESGEGEPVLTLRMNPSVGMVEEALVRECLLDSLGAASESAAVMAKMWRDAGTLRVAREAPVVSQAGKILHFHLQRKAGG